MDNTHQKNKPLSDSETKQTLISVAGKTVYKDKTRYVLRFVSIQRTKGTEYTVGTDGRRIFFMVEGHRAAIDPVFMRDIYKQMQELGKKFGFPPTIKVYYFDTQAPLVFTAEHNGITYQNLVMTIGDPVLDERGKHMREGGTYMYKTPDIKPGDIILGEQPTIYGSEQDTPQNTGTFSIFSPSERSGLSALRKLTTTGKEAKFRSDTLNQNVMLLPGSAGKLKNPENPESKIVGAYGFIHMIAGRMAHGEDLNEATYTAVKAIMAAVNGKIEEETSSKNKKEITLDGYNTWVYLKWQKEDKAWVVTGYKANDKHTSADDKRRAMNLAESYALETFGGLQQVGAALDYAIARLAREYKQNNADPKRKPVPSQQETKVSSPEVKALFQDGVLETATATFSLRRSTARNRQTLLSERKRTLLQTADYINRQAQRAGVHFAQATAIITALDKYIFSQDYITRGSAEYRKLRALRNYAEQYISVARKGKLPTRRATKDVRIPESESRPQT